MKNLQILRCFYTMMINEYQKLDNNVHQDIGSDALVVHGKSENMDHV